MKINNINEHKCIIFFHFAPPEIDSGSAVDSRNVIYELSDKCKHKYKLILITNDVKLLTKLIKTNRHRNIYKIYFLPIFENPLYSFKIVVSIIISLINLRHYLKNNIIYIAEEYPTVLLPLTILLRFLKNIIIYKQHSLNYVIYRESIIYTIYSLPKAVQRLIYILVVLIYSFIIKYLRPIAIVPNSSLVYILKNTLGIQAFFIAPGNYPEMITSFIVKPNSANWICSLSSKIDINYLRILNIFSKYFSTPIVLFGKPYGPQSSQIQEILRNTTTVIYKGSLHREKLLEIVVTSCNRSIYISGYETWAYALYELLITSSIVYVVFPSPNIANNLIKLYKEIFKDYIEIIYKYPLAIFKLRNIDSYILFQWQARYINGLYKLFEVISEAFK
jgi:hypothetical protein